MPTPFARVKAMQRLVLVYLKKGISLSIDNQDNRFPGQESVRGEY